VSINTYPDTHAQYAIRAIEAGAHVFVEKPLAQTVADAQRVVDVAKAHGRKVMVGYILRVHPSWTRFVELARTLGKPLVMRMNLNQQSIGPA
jgi:predicted dehydrogenase